MSNPVEGPEMSGTNGTAPWGESPLGPDPQLAEETQQVKEHVEEQMAKTEGPQGGEAQTVKRVFEIEWPEDHGPMWMNADNLRTCLLSKEHCLEAGILTVTDVTPSEGAAPTGEPPITINNDGRLWPPGSVSPEQKLHIQDHREPPTREELHKAINKWGSCSDKSARDPYNSDAGRNLATALTELNAVVSRFYPEEQQGEPPEEGKAACKGCGEIDDGTPHAIDCRVAIRDGLVRDYPDTPLPDALKNTGWFD